MTPALTRGSEDTGPRSASCLAAQNALTTLCLAGLGGAELPRSSSTSAANGLAALLVVELQGVRGPLEGAPVVPQAAGDAPVRRSVLLELAHGTRDNYTTVVTPRLFLVLLSFDDGKQDRKPEGPRSAFSR